VVTKIPEISFDRSVVELNGSLTIQSREFFRVIMDRALIIGTGSPEGVVEALQGASYMDDAGTAGAIHYLKRDNDDGIGPIPDKSKGWILV